jgi:catalase
MPDNFFAETEQVAFMTQNVPPGIDFSNDPLLQGRNFSYLDTQLKRLGSPNFTHIPINAPKCPYQNFQQDGHMAMHNPKGRANYEPNSWGDEGGPRESPEKGFVSYPAVEEGPKVRVRSETFADHYSQVRQFYISQTETEQTHIAEALTFELSKVETPAIRSRMVSHLLNIDDGLAKNVAEGLRLKTMPKPADAARPTRQDLKPSPKLSILLNGPKDFAGRKVGALVTDGVDADILSALEKALKAEGAMLKLVAPHVGGVEDSAGGWHDADEKIDGGPSVLFDAVAILPSPDGAAKLMTTPTARDFVADAIAHKKFIAYVDAATYLLNKAGAPATLDAGFVHLKAAKDCADFVAQCRKLRFWDRPTA